MNKDLSDRTKKTYEYVINHYVNDKYLLKPNKQINHFNNLCLSNDTIRICISAIMNYLKNNKSLLKDLDGNEFNNIINKYHDILMDIKEKAENDFKNHDKTKQFIPNFNDIIKIRDNYLNIINNNKLTNNKKLINYRKYLCSSLYTYHAPRRELDYSCMLIMNNMKDYNKYISKFINLDNLPYYCNEFNNKNNEFNINKDKKILNNFYIKDLGIFIFWNYKTFNKYGCQIIKVNDKLNDIIKEYININNLKSGDLLFKGKNFHLLINETFKSPIINNIPISINALRHSYINHFYNNLKGSDIVNNIDELSKLMGHSINTNLLYFKNNNDNVSINNNNNDD